MDVPEILTPRLRLRAFRLGDLEVFAAMSADAEVMRHIGTGGPIKRDMAWRSIALFIGHWSLLGYGQWALESRDSGELVGRAGLLNPEGWPEPEMGWLLGRDWWGRGLAAEAVRAALADAHRRCGIARPISLIRPDNERSAALARRLGAAPERTMDFMGAPTLVWRHASPDDAARQPG